MDVIDSTQNRHEFTRHDLHMNISGKERLAKILGQHIKTRLTNRNPPISINWKGTTSTEEAKTDFEHEHTTDVHTNPTRASPRPKKTPITRNSDFLWSTVTSKTVK